MAEGYGRPLCGSGARITCFAQSPSDPGTLAIARSDGSVTLARSAAASAVAIPAGDAGGATGEAVACCTFDASGAWLVAASRSGQLRYYSLLANEVAHTATVDCKPTVALPPFPRGTSVVRAWLCPAHSPAYVSCSQRTLRQWQGVTCALL